jgi:hypothetical protein
MERRVMGRLEGRRVEAVMPAQVGVQDREPSAVKMFAAEDVDPRFHGGGVFPPALFGRQDAASPGGRHAPRAAIRRYARKWRRKGLI